MKLFMVFGLLWWLLGNPFVAIIILLIVFYLLERRFIGLSPSIIRPFRRRSAIAKWQRELQLNPHDVSARQELARLLIEGHKFTQAREVLREIGPQMEHSAEYWSDLGTCQLALGQYEEGEQSMLRALDISPRVKYGAPYLRLSEAFAKTDPAKALRYLQQLQEMNASSCEAYYLMGRLYAELGQHEEAAAAFGQCQALYTTLPRYLRRKERKWALLSKLHKTRA